MNFRLSSSPAKAFGGSPRCWVSTLQRERPKPPEGGTPNGLVSTLQRVLAPATP